MARTIVGTVSRVGANKTSVVNVQGIIMHRYGKFVKTRKKIVVDTASCVDLAVGDVVEVTSCRPLSRTKRYRVVSRVTDANSAV